MLDQLDSSLSIPNVKMEPQQCANEPNKFYLAWQMGSRGTLRKIL